MVAVSSLHIEQYRSIRSLTVPLGQVTTVVGANGTGKSNLYRALRLLQAAASGRLVETFAQEGGMPSALYAGPKRRDEIHQVRLIVGVKLDSFSYQLACGLPTPRATVFKLDPEVKEEDLGVFVADRKRPVPLCERRNQVVTLRSDSGVRETLVEPFNAAESILSQLIDPRRFPELALMRMTLADWRFYHQIRTDADAPARQSRLGVRSPVLAEDGGNLAAVLQTIRELEHDNGQLDAAITKAFPGCSLEIDSDSRGLMALGWRQPGIHRTMDARELSDGTLRFLCLVAALLTPQPPSLLVLNEPEASLHPALLPALAQVIAVASQRCQILVTTHATELAQRVTALTGQSPVTLRLHNGQTEIDGPHFFGREA